MGTAIPHPLAFGWWWGWWWVVVLLHNFFSVFWLAAVSCSASVSPVFILVFHLCFQLASASLMASASPVHHLAFAFQAVVCLCRHKSFARRERLAGEGHTLCSNISSSCTLLPAGVPLRPGSFGICLWPRRAMGPRKTKITLLLFCLWQR